MAMPKAGERYKPERIILTKAVYSILSDLLEEEVICIRQCHSFSLWPAEAILVNGRKLDARTVEKLVNQNILEWREDKAQLTDCGRKRIETFDRITIDRRRKKQ